MEIPESRLIRGECLVRDLQLSEEVKLTRRGLIRYLALSLGLIYPNESRTGLLEVLEALLFFHYQKRETHTDPDIHQIIEKIAQIKKSNPNPKAVHYHLLQLKKLGIIEQKKRRYRFVLSPMQENDDLAEGLAYVFRQRFEASFEKIRKVLSLIEKSF
ncbi:MAG: hypothetical protein QXN37_02515 [Candidatus Anstonellaceae archaeon]